MYLDKGTSHACSHGWSRTKPEHIPWYQRSKINEKNGIVYGEAVTVTLNKIEAVIIKRAGNVWLTSKIKTGRNNYRDCTKSKGDKFGISYQDTRHNYHDAPSAL